MFGYLMSFSNRSYSLVHLTARLRRYKLQCLLAIHANWVRKESGTSMAAPFVSGAVALLLGACHQSHTDTN